MLLDPLFYCLQIVGHMFAYPVVYDLVADSDEEKQEVAAVLESIIGQCAWSPFAFLLSLHYPPSLPFFLTDHITSNGYYLVDVTNQSTRWGVWAPEQLNLNRSWSDDRGINSLQILSFLMSAFRITGKEKYLSAWKVGWLSRGLFVNGFISVDGKAVFCIERKSTFCIEGACIITEHVNKTNLWLLLTCLLAVSLLPLEQFMTEI